ncbi:class I SAM-dependent methyltransferase [Pseudonocardia abyssalis]|nr:class I SAM-dependent methyltransferase [Pseudonocardia abyssalis]
MDASNVDQLRAWDGPTGDFWADNADRFDAGVARYREPFLDAAAIGPTDAVLDVGCGAGQVTRDAARRATAGSALGVDLSARMLDLARRTAAAQGVGNAVFRHADAQTHAFDPGWFDVVVSRHGSMFFGDPPAAFANIARALRPGGRLVLLTWQGYERQEWMRTFRGAVAAGPIPATGPSPLSLSEPDVVRALLTGAGFTDVTVSGVVEPMWFGTDPDDALRFVAGQQAGMLADLDDATRAAALDTLRAALADHRTARGVEFDSAAWLVRATRP